MFWFSILTSKHTHLSTEYSTATLNVSTHICTILANTHSSHTHLQKIAAHEQEPIDFKVVNDLNKDTSPNSTLLSQLHHSSTTTDVDDYDSVYSDLQSTDSECQRL